LNLRLPLVPNYESTNSKCFIWCRLGSSIPLFLSLSCTEIVPNVGESGWSLVLGRRARARLRKLDGRWVQLPRRGLRDNFTSRWPKTTDAIQCPPSDNLRLARYSPNGKPHDARRNKNGLAATRCNRTAYLPEVQFVKRRDCNESASTTSLRQKRAHETSALRRDVPGNTHRRGCLDRGDIRVGCPQPEVADGVPRLLD
jgi:hypothetical protein